MKQRGAKTSDDLDADSPILASLNEVYLKYRDDLSGNVATYIPELGKADPGLFGIALATADGQIYEAGDARHLFTIQSVSKPFVYGFALEDHGIDYVLRKVGVEPTGEAFNSIVFDEKHNRPFNPMVNAGAIATTALIKGTGHDDRLARLLDKLSNLAGRSLDIDHSVYISERSTGHRNRAIGYLELNFGMLDDPVTEHLDLYFEQCSVLVSARDLAVMAATLANNGVNPLTGKRALDQRYVKNVLSVMHSCGMYDYAGEWSYRIGLPAKSGVSGGIIAVLPGQLGFGMFSAPLDGQGNSYRGIKACEELSGRFNLHMFQTRSAGSGVIRRVYRGDLVRSKRRRSGAEEAILSREGGKICVYELQGDLFFSTSEQVLRRITNELKSFSYLILDLKRVLETDECAVALLQRTRDMLTRHSKTLLLTSLPRPCLLTRDEIHSQADTLFTSVDGALEWCEDRILQRSPCEPVGDHRPVPLSAMDILVNFGDQELACIDSITVEKRYSTGAVIIREGDTADALYLLAKGRISIYLTLPGGRRQRLSTISPGLAFGELSLLDGGRRSADVIADEPTLCYVLPLGELELISKQHPEIRSKLIFNIGRELSARLRRADAEIRSLAD